MAELEEFRLDDSDEVAAETVDVRPGNVVVAVRNPGHLEHLEATLAKTDTRKIDIVVVTVHVSPRGSQAVSLGADQVFGTDERFLFSHVVTVAEKAGKHVELLAVPGADAWLAVVQTAQKLRSAAHRGGALAEVRCGHSRQDCRRSMGESASAAAVAIAGGCAGAAEVDLL